MTTLLPRGALVVISLAALIVIVEVMPWTFVYTLFLLAAAWLLLSSPQSMDAVILFLWPLLAIFTLGGLVSLLSGEFSTESVKGAYYASRPIVFMAVGLCLHRRGRLSFEALRSAIVLASVILSAFYIYTSMFNIGDVNGDRSALREAMGVGHITIAIGATLIITQLVSLRFRWVELAVLPLVLLAMYVSDSRSAYILVFAMLLCQYWNRFLSPVVAVSLMAIVLVLTTPLIELFLDADFLRLSFSTLPDAIVELISIQRITESEVNVGWRGFETYLAFSHVWQEDFTTQMFGTGWHALVPNPWLIKLGSEVLEGIPVFHNAWSFVFVRSGYIGLAMLFVQIWIWVSLFRRKLAAPAGTEADRVAKFAFGLVLVMLISIPTIASIYNPGATGEILCLFLGYCVGYAFQRPSNWALANRSTPGYAFILGGRFKSTA